MKLQRLAGYGSIAAFVSAAMLLVFAVLGNVMLPASLATVQAIAYFVAMSGWAAALAVALFDLEWMEHAATRTRWVQAALVAAIVAAVMPLFVMVALFRGTTVPYVLEIPTTLLLLGVGIGILIHSIEARRARLLHGALAWIGIVDGAFWIYLGILQFIFIFTPKLVMGFVYGLPVTELVYLVWAIWLGVHLTRARRTPVARPMAAAVASH